MCKLFSASPCKRVHFKRLFYQSITRKISQNCLCNQNNNLSEQMILIVCFIVLWIDCAESFSHAVSHINDIHSKNFVSLNMQNKNGMLTDFQTPF